MKSSILKGLGVGALLLALGGQAAYAQDRLLDAYAALKYRRTSLNRASVNIVQLSTGVVVRPWGH